MARIIIHKGSMSKIVSQSAFASMFAPAGWVKSPLSKEETEKKVESTENSQEDDFEENSLEEGVSEEDSEEVEEEDEEISLLKEKPISELDITELRMLAEYEGLDTTGMTSAKKLREALREVLR